MGTTRVRRYSHMTETQPVAKKKLRELTLVSRFRSPRTMTAEPTTTLPASARQDVNRTGGRSEMFKNIAMCLATRLAKFQIVKGSPFVSWSIETSSLLDTPTARTKIDARQRTTRQKASATPRRACTSLVCVCVREGRHNRAPLSCSLSGSIPFVRSTSTIMART